MGTRDGMAAAHAAEVDGYSTLNGYEMARTYDGREWMKLMEVRI